MTRRLIAPLLAAALALTPMAAAPARADGEDIAKALLGAVVLYGIAEGLDSRDRKDNRRVEQRHDDRRGWQDAHRGRTIPAQCIRTVQSRNGTRQFVPEACLRREGVRRLPDHCAVSISGPRRERDVYGLRCLQQSGFRVEGRRR
ncbi:hypothetical protein [Rhodovulum euryhalinum]|nr:hypothetical protein [Rhodovulum euryhalinum]